MTNQQKSQTEILVEKLDREPFHQQPIVAGRMCTGFLVKEEFRRKKQ